MNLSIRQLATFREVMRSGSISQAARTVGRTQPAVSTMIATMEDEIGFALFTREQGKLTATPEARFLLEEAEAILSRVERTKHTLQRIRALEEGALRIACHPAASSRFLPHLLTGFLAGRSEIRIALNMRSSDIIEDLVASQQFDLGFSETPRPRASIRQQDFDLECVCVMRADDPLARRAEITPALLDDQPMATLYEAHPMTAQTEAAFGATGHRLNKRLELRTFLPGLAFVASGYCYMICDMITAYSHLVQGAAPDLVIRRFRPRIGNGVSILTPGYVTQPLLARAFAGHLAQAIARMQEETEARLRAA